MSFLKARVTAGVVALNEACRNYKITARGSQQWPVEVHRNR